MKRVEITCLLENANFIINNLITKEDKENKKMTITIPVDIVDDHNNYEFLCGSDKVLEWNFCKEEENSKGVHEEEIDINITDYESFINFFGLVYGISKDYPALIPFTKTWKDIFKTFEINSNKDLLLEISTGLLEGIDIIKDIMSFGKYSSEIIREIARIIWKYNKDSIKRILERINFYLLSL